RRSGVLGGPRPGDERATGARGARPAGDALLAGRADARRGDAQNPGVHRAEGEDRRSDRALRAVRPQAGEGRDDAAAEAGSLIVVNSLPVHASRRMTSMVARARQNGPRILRNARTLGASAVQHLIDDPALFAVQISRRMPLGARLGAGRALTALGALLPRGAVVSSLGAFMAGDIDRASELVEEPGSSTALKGEVAILLGRPDLVTEESSPSTRARAAWAMGDLSGAVAILDFAGRGTSPQARRLRSELHLLTAGHRLEAPRDAVHRTRAARGERLRVLHLITNSLPHTQSGYALRTHNILRGLRDHGIDSIALTRTGYPVMVGKPWCADEDVVDGIHYRRTLPAKLASTPEGRLRQ